MSQNILHTKYRDNEQSGSNGLMERKFCQIKLDDSNTKAGAFSGYGAVFGNEDSYGDVIEQGAFSTSLQEWKETGKFPPMLLQHGGGLLGGADDLVPIGKWTAMTENARGLKVEGKLFGLSTDRGQYIYEGLKEGVLDGLSIGFRTREFRVGTKPKEPNRTLTDIDLVEVSIVTFPANPKARVSNVKSFTLEQKRELEAFLRDEGFSQKDAVTAVSAYQRYCQRDVGNLDKTVPRDAALPDLDPDTQALIAANELLQTFVIGCINI